MKYLNYLLFTFVLLLTYLLIVFDFTINNIFIKLLFCFIYFIVNLFILLKIKNNTLGNLMTVVLSLNYLLCCFTESYVLGIPLLFLAYIIYFKEFQLKLRLFLNGLIVVFFLTFCINSLVGRTIGISEMDRVYNNKGDIALVTVFIDAGATGGDYKYIIKKEYFGGLICLDQTIRLSNDSLQVYWVNTDTCIIDGILYNIWLP